MENKIEAVKWVQFLNLKVFLLIPHPITLCCMVYYFKENSKKLATKIYFKYSKKETKMLG